MPATDASSHRRRSSLVVLAASRRSRQRSSPLRGGHGGGLSSFAWRSRSRKQWRSFYTNFYKTIKKKLAHCVSGFRFFLSQGISLGLRSSFAVLAPPGIVFFTKSKPNNPNQQAKKVLPPLAVGGGHGGQRGRRTEGCILA